MQQPDQVMINPILVGASHGTAQYTDPIAAQSVQLQSCENNHTQKCM